MAHPTFARNEKLLGSCRFINFLCTQMSNVPLALRFRMGIARLHLLGCLRKSSQR